MGDLISVPNLGITNPSPFIALGFAALFMCVGAVTTLRWLVRLERRIRARIARRRRPQTRTRTVGTLARHRTRTPGIAAPLRTGPGPRDWSPPEL